ncbi:MULTISPECIES: ABC transporter ATP-binding protein [Cellulomonas]|uniref:ABC-2 type transport system ATP-binding protein n=1 Tax=Cellulomonas iranensis TaxID=76862 RepID=A0ABU0GKA9_9CELL|nr:MULTISPECIES: ABC transporter ATP-binding protein [Cellulomonas]MDQ0425758.1 ABC-2 type transport system ATP-binding protein [Cellulomonas iranensis]TFH71976.1 ABC transporter ATP-binding protein [Cellulomonas sp. HD19AZ1]
MTATTAGWGVELQGVTQRFGDVVALDDVSLTVRPGTITGLLGRNGSGKSTLGSLLAAFRRPTAGRVLVDGEEPWENERVVPGVCFVRESGDVLDDFSIKDNLAYVSGARPTFSHELAGELLDLFELDPKRKPGKFSRGKKSAFGIVLGLASRAPLTILDEVHLGLDAPSRYAFYDALLADYAAHPRTIVLSSHLIGEIERLVEDVVVLDRGRVLVAQDAETLRAEGVSVTGPAAAVEAFVAGREVLATQRLGGTTQATVRGGVAEGDVRRARQDGLELGPVPLQDLFVHLTDPQRATHVGGAR